ncbi:MAG: hypothetical protein AB8B50_09130 [Pirellulaceae bacterium]
MLEFPRNTKQSFCALDRSGFSSVSIGLSALLTLSVAQVWAADLAELLQESSNSKVASELVLELQADPTLELLEVLAVMREANASQKNWLISLAQVIADRDKQESKQRLSDFLKQEAQDSVARYWAFDFVTKGDEQARELFLNGATEDPCLDIRYEAIELALRNLDEAEALPAEDKKTQLKGLLTKARLAEQVQQIGSKLEELGEPQDLLQHFGFVANWSLIGPFDNTEMVGFAKQYAPELSLESGTSLAKSDSLEGIDGKSGKLSWIEVTTEDQGGMVDVGAALSKEKGAVAYLVGAFNSTESRKCQFRIGTPNATKIWLNGDLIMSREVYHSGNQVDQYVESVELKEGPNEIVIKSCQNEQTEPWAQDWAFQARFTDETGKAIQPAQ